MRQDLPESFKIQMQKLLGGEYGAYLESLDDPPAAGLRVNTLRWSPAEAKEKLGASLRPVSWTENGFYVGIDAKERFAKDPYYYAGLYYLQEPSAMAPARFLPVKPGDKVLDLCAAPGGKSTELGARLRGKGLLWANDISSSRAKALLKNLELFGIANICVSSEAPDKLAGLYPEYFDCILADAPCSGEGMFRRDPGMVKDWLKRGPEYYALVQAEILDQAVKLLRPGGYLLYSTCTFSLIEDEENVLALLRRYPEMELEPLEPFPGSCGGIGLEGCLRLFPHKLEGEGHFLALMRKKHAEEAEADGSRQEHELAADGVRQEHEPAADGHKPAADRDRPERKQAPDRAWHAPELTTDGKLPAGKLPEKIAETPELAAFLEKCGFAWEPGRFMINGEAVYYLPEGFMPARGIRYLRTGLYVGTVKKGRFEPSQAMAMVLSSETFADSISFSHEDERVVRYLKGETVFLREDEPKRQGLQLLCVDGHGLGFVKASGHTLKNKYYPGWRWM